jgi:hypothetical protein
MTTTVQTADKMAALTIADTWRLSPEVFEPLNIDNCVPSWRIKHGINFSEMLLLEPACWTHSFQDSSSSFRP